MSIEKDAETGVLEMKLIGKLDVFSFGELKSSLDSLFEKEANAKVVCDISQVSYIASSGWSVLLARRKMARRDEGDMVLTGMNGDIQRVYDSMKIQRLLPSASDKAGAIQMMKEAE